MEYRSWKVGVDFGSTYSSTAVCQVSGSAQGCVLQRIYPVRGSRSARSTSENEVCEFPTIILYEEEGRSLQWGWDAISALRKRDIYDPGRPIHLVELFKAGLHDSIESQSVTKRLAALPFRKTIDEVVTDYLTGLLQKTKKTLEDFGYEGGDSVHFICTVPAMWSKRGRIMTFEAMKRAKESCGFTHGKEVSLCQEPEAAAAYVFREDESVSLKKDDAFIVADGGGATVDLITYITDSVNPLRVKEVGQGAGQLCGSSYLNRSFRAHVEERLAGEDYLRAQPNSKPLEEIIRLNVMADFETVTKREYPIFPVEEENGDSMYTGYTIPGLQDDSNKGFKKSDITITRSQLEAVFLPVLEKCWALIEKQLRQAYSQLIYPKLLILVGGFAGSSRYKDFIKEKCELFNAQHALGNPVKVIVPHTPGNAMAVGAIRYFLGGDLVQEHFSRSCVCITRHLQDDRPASQFKKAVFTDDLDGKKYVRDCVDILLGTNEVIPSTGRTVKKRLYRMLRADQDVADVEIAIYVFEEHDAIQDHPIETFKNQSHHFLGMAKFEVQIAPIRDQLKKMKFGTNKPLDQPRRRGRSHYRRVLEPHKVSNGVSDELEEQSPYYFFIEYDFEIKFIGGLMEYHLRIENVEGTNKSSKGTFDLTTIIDPR